MSEPIAFKALGNKGNEYTGLETFPAPELTSTVVLFSDEVTAVCPVTGQPDWYTVRVTYVPSNKCIESKTFKLFLQTLRQKGMFCEALSTHILREVVNAVLPVSAAVEVVQKPRGGVSIIATAKYN